MRLLVPPTSPQRVAAKRATALPAFSLAFKALATSGSEGGPRRNPIRG